MITELQLRLQLPYADSYVFTKCFNAYLFCCAEHFKLPSLEVSREFSTFY